MQINELEKIINNISKNQLDNGCFFDMAGGEELPSTLSTALVLNCLNNIRLDNSEISKIKNKAAEFLLKQKRSDWTYRFDVTKPTHLGLTFCVLSSLQAYDKKILSGADLAKILKLLTAAEIKEGGPYKDKYGAQVDLWANCQVANFLSFHDVSLPALYNLIEQAIDTNNFESAIFENINPVIYAISRVYNGEKKSEFINYLLDHYQQSDRLSAIFIASSLINLGYSGEVLKKIIASINMDIIIKTGDYKIPDLDNNFQSVYFSPALFWALYLEILAKQQNQTPSKITESKYFDKNLYEEITNLAKRKFASLPPDLCCELEKILDRVLHFDKIKEIVLLPYYMKVSLVETGKEISNEFIKKLGLASLYLWLAYTIYDDFLDEEAKPINLSAANVCLRKMIIIYNEILPTNNNFRQFLSSLMDKVDSANAWEIANCREKVLDGKIIIKRIPDFENFIKLSDRSIAHALAAAAVFFLLGFNQESPEIKNLIEYFTQYLSARQLNDDAHDWEDDLKKGQINSAVAEIFKQIGIGKIIDLNDEGIKKLQLENWTEMVVKISKEVLNKIKMAKDAINQIGIIKDKTIFFKMLEPTEKAALRAIKEKKDYDKFVEEYTK